LHVSSRSVARVPTGTVTFLFTDMEGSTRRWEDDPDVMQEALARHDTIVRAAVDAHDGYVFATGGDGFAVAFALPVDAIAAATSAQIALSAAQLPPVRMGVHTGEAHERGGDYFGPTVNRSARLMAIGHGGQVLVSFATAQVAANVELRDLGEYRLRDLSRPERVFQLVVPGTNNEFPPLRTLDVLPTNLPVQTSRFVGRTEETRRVIAGLEQSRLVTLTGVGGVGKTRLALQVTAELLPAYPDGAWLVELAGVTDPAMVAETVRSVLGVQQQPGKSVEDCVIEHFSARCLVLVLDNCEHVIGVAADLAMRLVSSAGGSRVLATSREGLAVQGERVVAVPPLAVPSEDFPELVLASDAVRLFIDRAADARDGFSAGDDDIATLARLCRRLDGIPLAIELAAARVRSIALPDILAHLDQRFQLLSAGRRTAPTRQQTLHNAIDWSYELLDEPERIMLRRLCVFAGGFDLPAVQAVAADEFIDVFEVVDLLDRLVDKSLVVVDVLSAATRFRLLETIRDYGWERLGEAAEGATFARRHAEYFADFSTRAGTGLRGRDEARWSDVIEVEMENLRLALTWAIASEDADLALRIVGGLAVSGYRVGVPFGNAALAAGALDGAMGHPLRALALASAAWATFRLGEYERATELGEAALQAARDQPESDSQLRTLGQALSVLTSVLAVRPGLFERATALAEERVAVARALGDHYEMVQALSLRAPLLGDAEAAEEGVRLARIVANPTMLSYACSVLAMLILVADPLRARDLVDESAGIAIDAGNDQAAALAQQVLGAVLGKLGDHVSAVRIGLTAVEQLFEQGERFYAFSQLWGVAASLNALGEHETAVTLGAWLAHRGASISGPSGLPPRASVNLSNELTSEEIDRCDPRVLAMTDAEAIAYARAAVDQHELVAPRN
jgi:predicted ATPase/class 3 adenylate cyclase